MEIVRPFAEWGALSMEVLGVSMIIVLALHALMTGAIQLFKHGITDAIFHQVRMRLGRGILLGLEFLVAADIIHTVAVELTFTTVGTLAVIVLIRTFLSFTLELELTGRWPWQQKE